MTVVAVGTASYGNDIPRESEPLGYAGYGPGWIVARDQFGFFHLFAHIVEPGVLVDDNVVTGYPIARVSTRSRHLHWEIRRRQFAVHGTDTFANTIDPFAWLTTQEERNE
jgi:murein DD-endopeptidase MepM/ murein hydrolase activator NlpD